jgi:hypothetical protein
MDVELSLMLTEAKAIIAEEQGSLLGMLKAAMKATRNHWMCLNEDKQFRAAVGAVMLHYGKDSEEYERLGKEMDSLNKASAVFTALQVGVPIDWESMETESDYEPIGLLKLWKNEKIA